MTARCKTLSVALLGLFAWLASVPTANADQTIELLDKTKIVGKLLHYYEGVLSIQLPNGTSLQLPATKVSRILFKLPQPRPELSSPQKTFARMKKAALANDIETYIDCHSTYYQMFLNHQVLLAKPGPFAKRLRKEWQETRIEVVSTTIDKETAVMKVRRPKADEAEEGEFRFVRENGEWKMILPL